MPASLVPYLCLVPRLAADAYLSLVVTKAKEVFAASPSRGVNAWGTRIGDRSRVGGAGILCDPRRLALYETMTHLVCLNAMTVGAETRLHTHGHCV